MIKTKSVFILGAGASLSYGLPTGKRLRELICNSEMISHLSGIREYANYAEHFVNKFSNSQTFSIDLFLQRNKELSDIGKYAIAWQIFRAETNGLSNKKEKEDDWYPYLFHKMTEKLTSPDSWRNIGQNRVTFITFNYDRSLEYYLHRFLINAFDTGDHEIELIKELREIKIYHVYGSLGPLAWQAQDGSITPYGSADKYSSGPLKDRISIIRETIDSPEINMMKNAISEAPRIIFLGFSYAPENMEILDLPHTIKPDCGIFGTAYDLLQKENERIKKIFDIRHSGTGAKSTIYEKKIDCTTALRRIMGYEY